MKYQTLNNRFKTIQVRKKRGTLTVPDMSFTPREIISKFSRGEKVPLGFQGRYDSEDPTDDPKFRGYDPAIFEDDPTRDPTFDFGDYVEEKHAMKERERERNSAQKRKKSLDSKRKASAEELSVSDVMKRETTSEETKVSPSVSNEAKE